MSKAIYAFSGDPITFGHLDIIERAAAVFEELTVAIGINPAKKYLFDLQERARMAEEATSHLPNVRVVYFKGLLVDYAYEQNIPVIVRGLRNTEDFNFELMLHQVGESQKMHLETFFIPSRQELSHISSGAAKALQLEQGLIHEYVPLNVKQKLEIKLSCQYIIGVTGVIGAGKSYVCNALQQAGRALGIEVHRIDLDRYGHDLLQVLKEPVFIELRKKICGEFGSHLLQKDGFVDVAQLGKIIFADQEKLNRFNRMMYQPMLLKIRRELYGKRGILLLDSALIAETGMSYLCNNHCLLVETSEDLQWERLKKRHYSDDQIKERRQCQYTSELKLEVLQEQVQKDRYGQLIRVANTGD